MFKQLVCYYPLYINIWLTVGSTFWNKTFNFLRSTLIVNRFFFWTTTTTTVCLIISSTQTKWLHSFVNNSGFVEKFWNVLLIHWISPWSTYVISNRFYCSHQQFYRILFQEMNLNQLQYNVWQLWKIHWFNFRTRANFLPYNNHIRNWHIA